MNEISDYLTIYLQNRPFFLALLRAKELELFSRYLPLGGQILDVGSGDGFFAKALLSCRTPIRHPGFSNKQINGSRVPPTLKASDGHSKPGMTNKIDVGLDLEDSRLPESRELNIYKKLVTYDGHKFPFPANKFQTVISNCVFEHIPNIEEIVGEIYRVTKPGGRLITTVMAAPWNKNLLGAAIFGQKYSNWMRKKQVHYNLYTDKKWDQLFNSCGFKITKKIGYLDRRASRLIDLGHYLSVPSLISYKLTGRWVLNRNLANIYPLNSLKKLISEEVEVSKASALFYVLTK